MAKLQKTIQSRLTCCEKGQRKLLFSITDKEALTYKEAYYTEILLHPCFYNRFESGGLELNFTIKVNPFKIFFTLTMATLCLDLDRVDNGFCNCQMALA